MPELPSMRRINSLAQLELGLCGDSSRRIRASVNVSANGEQSAP